MIELMDIDLVLDAVRAGMTIVIVRKGNLVPFCVWRVIRQPNPKAVYLTVAGVDKRLTVREFRALIRSYGRGMIDVVQYASPYRPNKKYPYEPGLVTGLVWPAVKDDPWKL